MDTVIAELLDNNARYASSHDANRALRPQLDLAILCCMDHRVATTLMEFLGITRDDADIITNAGGLATDDAIRSLTVSQRKKGTRRIMVVAHTKCGMTGLDEDDFRRELQTETGLTPPAFHAFADPFDAVRRSLATLRTSPWLSSRDAIYGFVFDLDTGTLHPVDPGVVPPSTEQRGLGA
jgi:carbonic anhydrase